MRRFFRRLNHRDAVMTHLNALLLVYPRGRQFAHDFPTLKATIRADFEAGVPPTIAALRIAGSILGRFLGQLDAGEKARVLEALVERGRAGFAELARQRVKGARGKVGDRLQFVTQLAGAAIYIAERMAEEGALRFDEYADFITRIETALGVAPMGQQPLARAFSA